MSKRKEEAGFNVVWGMDMEPSPKRRKTPHKKQKGLQSKTHAEANIQQAEVLDTTAAQQTSKKSPRLRLSRPSLANILSRATELPAEESVGKAKRVKFKEEIEKEAEEASLRQKATSSLALPPPPTQIGSGNFAAASPAAAQPTPVYGKKRSSPGGQDALLFDHAVLGTRLPGKASFELKEKPSALEPEAQAAEARQRPSTIVPKRPPPKPSKQIYLPPATKTVIRRPKPRAANVVQRPTPRVPKEKTLKLSIYTPPASPQSPRKSRRKKNKPGRLSMSPPPPESIEEGASYVAVEGKDAPSIGARGRRSQGAKRKRLGTRKAAFAGRKKLEELKRVAISIAKGGSRKPVLAAGSAWKGTGSAKKTGSAGSKRDKSENRTPTASRPKSKGSVGKQPKTPTKKGSSGKAKGSESRKPTRVPMTWLSLSSLRGSRTPPRIPTSSLCLLEPPKAKRPRNKSTSGKGSGRTKSK